MAHMRLNISGMRGVPCQEKVERALKGLPGVWAAVVCLDQGYVDVEYQDDYGPATEEMIAVVKEAGYGARVGG
jgi:copper chaperone CopZ